MFESLRKIFPPDAVIDIGIGSGFGVMHQWQNWDVPTALLIDANKSRIQWAKELAAKYDGWHLEVELLSDSSRKEEFSIVSNEVESSLLEVDSLRLFWSNLQLKKSVPMQAKRLDDILSLNADFSILDESSCIWGGVDCLGALSILKGAGEEFKKWSVISVRVLIDDSLLDAYKDSHIRTISEFLELSDFRLVEVIEENHPAIGCALFVRNWRGHIKNQKSQFRQVEKYKNKINQLLNSQTEHLKQIKGYEIQANELLEFKANNNGQLKKISEENGDYLNQIQDYIYKIKKLSDESLSQQKKIENQSIKAKEQNYRQQLINEEFIKAEAQIDLIKDVLLREKTI